MSHTEEEDPEFDEPPKIEPEVQRFLDSLTVEDIARMEAYSATLPPWV